MVGINDYNHFTKLECAKEDAEAVYTALEDMGVQKVTKAIDCTYSQLIKKKDEYLSQLKEGDVAFVYCATHGARYQNEHVVLAADSKMTNLAETSLSTLSLLHRSGTCCDVCT